MSKRRVLIDACVFMARKVQDCPPEAVTAIQSLLEEIEKGKTHCVVSTLIFAELLDGTFEQLESLLSSSKATAYDVEPPIARLGRDIRKSVVRDKAGLDLADCIYIATAKIYNCDCLVTIDGLVTGPNGLAAVSAKHRLLSASELIKSKYGVTVCAPMQAADQHVMNFNEPDNSH